jgi:hypothetical protein
MPSRNQARFLPSAVASVYADSGDYALIVQDGSSTDESPAVLTALAARHPGMQVVTEPDSGPADALNRAFRRALDTQAPVIGWLNSDDLYTPGATHRALQYLANHADDVAVYGDAEHIDVEGRRLGSYPTLRPDVPLDRWRDGCPVCQPTMFMRREAVLALMPLDTELRTAFDYDAWLRLFKAYAGHIGFLPAVQAQSRLHSEGITMRLREQVALEGMKVVHRHLGPAPAHWLITHLGEALAACPFDAETAAVQAHLLALADQAAPWLGPGGADELKLQMQSCSAWRLLHPHVVAGVHADGWAGPQLELRLRQPMPPDERVCHVRLHGRHAWPRPGRLRLRLTACLDGSQLATTSAWWRQKFVLDIPVTERTGGAELRFQVLADDAFVPAVAVSGALDHRTLAFMVDQVETLSAS